MSCADCRAEGADCLTADRVRVCSDCLYERVVKERDEARAEVERLKVELQVAPDRWAELLATSEQRVAERQREACARWTDWTPTYTASETALKRKLADAVRATPLVTEVDK